LKISTIKKTSIEAGSNHTPAQVILLRNSEHEIKVLLNHTTKRQESIDQPLTLSFFWRFYHMQ